MPTEKKAQYEKPSVTVDIVIFTVREQQLQLLLVKRAVQPFKGRWALPGGFVRIDESLEHAARRELQEETGVHNLYLEQLYTFGAPKRDPRGRVITVAYLALIRSEGIQLRASTDASEAQWFPVAKLPALAFDHAHIVTYALKRLRWKFEYTNVGFSMLPARFTLGQLLHLYEIVFMKKFDKRNFIKKVLSLNILKEEGVQKDVPHRPPQLYSLKKKIGEIVEML